MWLLAFWPGVLSIDSLSQWRQLHSFDLTDAHPALHTLTMWLVTRPWDSPAAVAVAQIAVLGALVGITLAGLERRGAPRRVVVGVAVVVALLPGPAVLAVTLWKDVAYAAAVLGLTHAVVQTACSGGEWLRRPRAVVALGASGSAAALLHHGGRAVAAGTLLALVLAFRAWWRPIAVAAVGVAASWVLLNGVLLSVLDVERDHPGAGQIAIHHIAAHLAAGTRTTAAERAVLARVLPPDWAYECREHNAVVHSTAPGRDDRWTALREESGPLVRMAAAMALRDPTVDARHLACRTMLVWSIWGRAYGSTVRQVGDGPLTESNFLTMDQRSERLAGIRREPVVDALTLPLGRVVVETGRPALAWLFWRGPFAFYGLLAAVAVAARRSADRRLLVIAVPSVMVAAVLLVAAPDQDFRYMFPVYLSAAVVAVPLASRRPVAVPEPETTIAVRP